MKNLIKYIILIVFIPSSISSQNIENINVIAPFSEGLAAIQKGNEWAFVDKNGTIIIDFRDDIVISSIEEYPLFINDRCLIKKLKNGICYFGYIDKTGKTVIDPMYLNASNFNNSKAIVLKLIKNVLGTNDVLDKKIIDYDYIEVIINTNNDILQYISEPYHITLSKDYLRTPPLIKSKLISDSIIATLNKNNTWSIIPIK